MLEWYNAAFSQHIQLFYIYYITEVEQELQFLLLLSIMLKKSFIGLK